MIIAIDGPSGAGKSTVAKAVARELGFECLDTGAMYRAIAYEAVCEGAALDDDAALGRIAERHKVTFSHDDGDPIPRYVFLDGSDVTSKIRTTEIDRAVSPVSAAPSVRRALVGQQREIGQAGDYVVEGRDIGTHVFPDAALKIYLTASDEQRAHRRARQNAESGIGTYQFEDVLDDIRRRDEYDSSREVSPLEAAEDAIVLDTTDLYIEDVIGRIIDLFSECREKLSEENNIGKIGITDKDVADD
ncbi:MAG: (d)CMP kinase [Eggerthellaceae bacterium]|nr:(d)CMP kinase [Eggerthellaceae bacterium]